MIFRVESSNGMKVVWFFKVQNHQSKIYKESFFMSGESVPVSDWVRMSYAYAEHRMAYTVDEGDVHQVSP